MYYLEMIHFLHAPSLGNDKFSVRLDYLRRQFDLSSMKLHTFDWSHRKEAAKAMENNKYSVVT